MLSEDQAASFLKVADEMRHGLLFEFALLTGMRPEEYLALQWPDLDFECCTAMVQRALIRRKKSWIRRKPVGRIISLPPTLVNKLAAHKRRQLEELFRKGSSWLDYK